MFEGIINNGSPESKAEILRLLPALPQNDENDAKMLAERLLPQVVALAAEKPHVAEKAARLLWFFSLFDSLLPKLFEQRNLIRNLAHLAEVRLLLYFTK